MVPREIKTLTLFGFITCVIVTAVALYAVEDLPAFGDENSAVNKHIKLFSIPANASLIDTLNAGILPEEIKAGIYRLGFVKGPIFPGAQNENYPTLDEGNYEIEKTEAGSVELGRLSEDGWDILVKEGEIFYQDPIVWYFVKEIDGNLTVYRYNWPARIMEKTEEETLMINAVTSGLADYRGYDTMGEETVILTGAIGVILLMRRRGRL